MLRALLLLSVRREYVLEDSFHQMVLRRPDELKVVFETSCSDWFSQDICFDFVICSQISLWSRVGCM